MRIRLTSALLGLAAFAALWLSLRVFWADCDPGVPAAWEYGYNATDEGYYLDGGKEKLLWGTFTDLARTEAFSYGFSPATHGLSYLAHLCFGLSTWTWRIPFFLINFLAWCVMMCHLSRRRGPVAAFLLCAAVSCVPMIVAYERTASNDVLIGSLLMLAYCVASGGTKARLLASAVLTSAIVLVKPSVWVLLPIVLSAALDGEPRFRRRWIDAAMFLAASVAGVFAWRLLSALALLPDAAREGCSVFEIVRKTTTHYPLPSIFAFADHFRGLSAFPRDPSGRMLGFLAVLLVPVPLFFAAREALARRNVSRLVLFLAIPLYVGAVSVMNTLYTHYFIPVVMMLPALFDRMAATLEDGGTAEDVGVRSFRFRIFCLVFAGVAVLSSLALMTYRIDPKLLQGVYSRVYNLPQVNVWAAVTGPFVVGVLLGVGLMAAFAPRQRLLSAAAAAIPMAALASAVLAYLPSVTIAPHIHEQSDTYLVPMLFNLVLGLLLTFGSLALPRLFARRFVLPSMLAAAVVLGLLLMPNWRAAGSQLMAKGTHLHREAAAELAKLLPPDAIVIGERSNQMLMSVPVRTVTTFPMNSDPVKAIASIRTRYPDAPIYALADSQHAYMLQHFREHAQDYRLDLVRKFSMPSFATGKPADVYLCRVTETKVDAGRKVSEQKK